MAEDPHDLDDLLRRAAHGDRAAFAAFYDATAPQAHHLALTVAGDPGRAQTALRSAYLTAWRTAAAPRGGWSPRPWLLSLVQATARRAAVPGPPGPRAPRRVRRLRALPH